MGRPPGVSRALLARLVLVSLLFGCQSVPPSDVVISPQSSLLAVDVLFPAPLSRDPSLVQVYFVRGPIQAGTTELPEFIPASFVKFDRAYLLDPEPGSYSVVAAMAAYGPPFNEYRIAGVDKTTWSRTNSDAMVFPAELIRRTPTSVTPGRVAYMGVLRIRRGDRIDAETRFQDELQRRIAEQLRPGVTSESGLTGWLKRTRLVNLEGTSISNELDDRETFLDIAMADLEESPWLRVVAGAAPTEATASRSPAPAASPKRMDPQPQPQPPAVVPPRVAVVPRGSTSEPPTEAPDAEAASDVQPHSPPQPKAEPTAEPELAVAAVAPQSTAPESEATGADLQRLSPLPEASPPSPAPRRFSGVPPESPLSQIEFGMSHRDVRKIAGAPDGRLDRVTAKAWIPFYNGPGANLRDWIYEGNGRVVFSLYDSRLTVIDVVYDPSQRK